MAKGISYNRGVHKYPGPGNPSIPPETRATVLPYLAECGNLAEACRRTGISRQSVLRWVNPNSKYYDPIFAEAYAEAMEMGARGLEDEARRRAYYGWQEPVVYQGEISTQKELEVDPDTGEVIAERRVPVSVTRYDSGLLKFLLQGAWPEKYRTNVHQQVDARVEQRVELDLSKLDDDEIRQLQELTKKASITP